MVNLYFSSQTFSIECKIGAYKENKHAGGQICDSLGESKVEYCLEKFGISQFLFSIMNDGSCTVKVFD